MSKGAKIYEGKAKILYESGAPGQIIQHFKDDTTAFNAQKKEVIEGKGILNNMISEYIFQRLADIGIPTHFIKRVNMREQLVMQLDIIPVEVVIRNVAAGSLCKRLGLEEGKPLARPLLEYFYKSDKLGDPMISDEHILAFDWATPYELQAMVSLTIRINDFLSGLFAGVGLRLVDFKVEFGRLPDEDSDAIYLADEISPDNCRLWDMRTNEVMDKDRFRKDLGNVRGAYQEVARRLGILPPDNVIPME